jgi:hypothetical protein
MKIKNENKMRNDAKINMATNLTNNRIVSTDINNCIAKIMPLNPTTQKTKIVVSVHSEKKSGQALPNSTHKLSGYGMDLIVLLIIIIVPIIPFWQL